MPVRNRFEQVDEPQEDAITLALRRTPESAVATITFPAAASGGRLASDCVSGDLPLVEGFRSAIRLANRVRVPVVVIDPDQLWQPEWGELYRAVED